MSTEEYPCMEKCSKCGSRNVKVHFFMKGQDLGHGPGYRDTSDTEAMRIQELHLYATAGIDPGVPMSLAEVADIDILERTRAKEDCVMHTCRSCQYVWIGPPMAEAMDSRGGALWFDRDEWGIIIDALIDHRANSELRAMANAASSSGLRAEVCVALIDRIGKAAATFSLSQDPQPKHEDA